MFSPSILVLHRPFWKLSCQPFSAVSGHISVVMLLHDTNTIVRCHEELGWMLQQKYDSYRLEMGERPLPILFTNTIHVQSMLVLIAVWTCSPILSWSFRGLFVQHGNGHPYLCCLLRFLRQVNHVSDFARTLVLCVCIDSLIHVILLLKSIFLGKRIT